MKRVILIISLVLIGLGTTQAQDIFKKYGHKKEMLTLSKGKYQEVFKNEEVVQIGTVLLNTKTNKIVKLLQEDTTKINYNAELSSRFLTVDPMAEEYYSYSPYAYAMNNPVYYVDPTGEFSTKFGAWLYKVFNGGGDILQDKGGEYFVSQQVEYTGEGIGAAVSRKFDWSGRSTGKDLAFEAKLDAFKTDMEFQQLCEQHGMEYVRYDNRSDAIAGMLQPASAVLLPNPIVRSANTAINSSKVATPAVSNAISTGRTTAATLAEQLAMKEIISNPSMGKVIMTGLSDARLAGFSKMQYVKKLSDGTKVVIHYVAKIENGVVTAVKDFKFK